MKSNSGYAQAQRLEKYDMPMSFTSKDVAMKELKSMEENLASALKPLVSNCRISHQRF